jgi:photosystem II stability/assembly factor-like uncharacterized protein
LWQASSKGLPANSKISGLMTDWRRPELVYALMGDGRLAGTSEPPTLLRSTDGGRSWSAAARALPGIIPLSWAIDPNDASTLYIGTYDRLLRSRDGGVNWSTLRFATQGLYAVSALAVAPSDSNVIYSGGQPAQRSADRGI